MSSLHQIGVLVAMDYTRWPVVPDLARGAPAHHWAFLLRESTVRKRASHASHAAYSLGHSPMASPPLLLWKEFSQITVSTIKRCALHFNEGECIDHGISLASKHLRKGVIKREGGALKFRVYQNSLIDFSMQFMSSTRISLKNFEIRLQNISGSIACHVVAQFSAT